MATSDTGPTTDSEIESAGEQLPVSQAPVPAAMPEASEVDPAADLSLIHI